MRRWACKRGEAEGLGRAAPSPKPRPSPGSYNLAITSSRGSSMQNDRDMQALCAEVIAVFGRDWNLTVEQETAYAQAMIMYVQDHYTEAEIYRLIHYYHLDHREVGALRDPQHPRHQESWRNWRRHIVRILRSTDLDWLPDSAIDFEDLVQIALEELNEAIATYRFNSRFSTWAYTVVVRAAQHVIRERRAAKRSGTLIPLD